MQRPHPAASRERSGFVAAFLSLLFPGLGHAYLGAWRRGLGWAAVPLLLLALAGGVALRLSRFDLAGLAVQQSFLDALFVGNLITFAYRAAATVDAWWIAHRLAPPAYPRAARGGGTAATLRSAGSMLSIAGLAAVLLVMSVAHVAVARYDRLLSDLVGCVFTTDAAVCQPAESAAPGGSGEPAPSVDQGGVPSAPGTVGPPIASATPGSPWDGKSRLNILLIGVDEQGGAHNTDTMITVSIDPTTHQVVLFQLPRDTVDVPIPPGPARNVYGSTFQGKINAWWSAVHNRSDWYPGNAATNQPGYNGLKAILGNLYGLDINYFVEVNFGGFTKIVDVLGGVTVNVQVPVVDDRYPVPGGTLQRLYIPAGLQHMDGAAALRYSRSRHQSSDFDRGARQQRVLVSLREQTDIASILPSLDQLTAAIQQSVRTDIPPSLVPQLLQVASGIDARSIRSVIFTPPYYGTEGSDPVRGYIIEPNVSRIRAAVRAAFTVDPAFAEAHDAIAEEGATAWVLNGSGRSGQAASLAAYLDYLGIAATAPAQRPDTTGLPTTTIKAYNGAEGTDPLTAAALQQVFGVTVQPVTDPLVHVDFIVITGRQTPTLTPPPVP
ncbi:MAG TPA: LCP family protein [Candidatus Limnocylindrales bacterium]|nr:LCP family protein [Candidatus Limnocylindrales bacterium]